MNVRTMLMIVSLLLVAVGCGDPKDVELSTLTQEQTAKLEKKLNGEEMRLLMGYQLRHSMSAALGGKAAPAGVTVNQAIKDQREWVEKQKQEELVAAERRRKEEADAAELKKKLDAEQKAKQEEFAKLLSAVLVGKRNVDQSYGRKFVSLQMAYENKTDKDIAGVKGVLRLTDMFDDKIMNVRWSYDGGIRAKQTIVEKGSGVDINEFKDTDMKLWNTDQDKLKAIFEPSTIIFRDGTRLDAPK